MIRNLMKVFWYRNSFLATKASEPATYICIELAHCMTAKDLQQVSGYMRELYKQEVRRDDKPETKSV